MLLVESPLPLFFLFLQAGELFASFFTLVWRSSHVVLLSVRRAEPRRQGTGGTFLEKKVRRKLLCSRRGLLAIA